MASGFFALLDDIASLMDDVAVMGKVAGKKTASILGDDLAVNAEKASGFLASRELPVLWEITKGSILNKIIILPIAFLLSAYLPQVITVILILGGLYLAYEGAEKIYAYFFHSKHEIKADKNNEGQGVEAAEKQKIKSAIVTDFILSIEIIIIALSSVSHKPISVQIPVVALIAFAATVGVYGLVALIVRMDDMGLKLIQFNKEDNTFSDKLGIFLIRALPLVIKSLNVIGTIALLMVSGGLFVHNISFIHHLEELLPIPSLLFEILSGFLVGLLVLIMVSTFNIIWKKFKVKS